LISGHRIAHDIRQISDVMGALEVPES
jgi:hypothetical protein